MKGLPCDTLTGIGRPRKILVKGPARENYKKDGENPEAKEKTENENSDKPSTNTETRSEAMNTESPKNTGGAAVSSAWGAGRHTRQDGG